MKQQKILLAALILTVGLLIVGTGVVLARGFQHGTPPVGPGDESTQGDQAFWTPMHGSGWRREDKTSFPPMMAAMIDALIDVTGLTEVEILAKVEDGQHLYDIAFEAGISEEDYLDMMSTVREDVLSDNAALWGEDHPHMSSYGRRSETNEGESFVPPCFRSGESGSSMYGVPSQNNGW